MPRQPRYDIIGLPQHVIQRGINRQPVFFDETDYRRYLDDLREVSNKVGCRIHCFVLMPNHVHLLVTPVKSKGISRLMQGLGRRYVVYINQTYRRTGTLWEGRYRAGLVGTDDYLLTCMRYVELNPVRAGMVGHPTDYRWSSYRWNALGDPSVFGVDPHERYLSLDTDASTRNKAYRKLFDVALDRGQLQEIRSSLNACLAFGDDRFKEQVEAQLKRKVRPGKAGRPKKGNMAV